MDRKTSAGRGQSLRTLGEDELAEVTGAGGCHGHHRKHHHHHNSDSHGQGGQGGLSPSILSLLQQNLSVIIQVITGNSGNVTAVAGAAQGNLSA